MAARLSVVPRLGVRENWLGMLRVAGRPAERIGELGTYVRAMFRRAVLAFDREGLVCDPGRRVTVRVVVLCDEEAVPEGEEVCEVLIMVLGAYRSPWSWKGASWFENRASSAASTTLTKTFHTTNCNRNHETSCRTATGSAGG